MADKKITQLTNITGANLVNADEFVVVDISADVTKSITLAELKVAVDSGSGFVRIIGDTMTGDLTVPNLVVSGTVDGVDIAARDAILTSTTTTANAALPKAGGTMTGDLTVPNVIVSGNVDGVDIAARDAVLTSTTTTAGAALPKAGGALTGAVTTNSTFDGVDIAARDAILTSTTTTANAALPKSGGTMTGVIAGFESTGISDNATSTAMTLDGSGNLLVGKTSSSLSTAGAELRSGGAITGTVSGGVVAALNRLTNDGNILTFNKDGTTVGSIGIHTDGFYIDGEANHAGIRFGGNNISPRDGGVDTDNQISLGQDILRFNNLYLSGGVYLGGTGAANKLDDYEEGTWTPIYYDANAATELAGVVYNSRRYGKYTKVGNLVTVYFQIITDAMTLTGASGNDVWLSGLPFPVGTLSASDGNSDIGAYVAASPTRFNDIPIRSEASAGYTGFILRTSTGTFEINDMQTGSSDNNLQGSITYPTNS